MYYEWNKARTNPEFRRLPGAKFYHLIQSNKLIRSSLQIISAGVMVFLICIIYTETRVAEVVQWPQMLSNFFNAFHRIIFVSAVGLFFSGPLVGKTYLLRFIFGGSFWAPWAKITFIVYLIHILVVIWFYAQTNQAMFITERTAIFSFFSAFILSFLLAIPVTLLIESPVMQFEKLVMFPPKQKEQVIVEDQQDMGLIEKFQMNKIQDANTDDSK